MEKMKDIISRIDSIIQERQADISKAQAAILENQKVIDEANAAAAAALAAGDENAYVAAKQKAAEGAARLEYNQQRIIKLKEHQPRPDAREIRQAAMAASVTAYKAIAARILELINELVTASDEAAAVVGQYNTTRNKWQSYVDNSEYWPDLPDQTAVGIVRNLSFARDNLSAYLGKK